MVHRDRYLMRQLHQGRLVYGCQQFLEMMDLPALDASNFSVIYPDGPPIANLYPTGWPIEISLDVEWAHAIAPKAKLVLVVAPSDDADELAYALDYAVTHHLGQVISNSYGYPKQAISRRRRAPSTR